MTPIPYQRESLSSTTFKLSSAHLEWKISFKRLTLLLTHLNSRCSKDTAGQFLSPKMNLCLRQRLKFIQAQTRLNHINQTKMTISLHYQPRIMLYAQKKAKMSSILLTKSCMPSLLDRTIKKTRRTSNNWQEIAETRVKALKKLLCSKIASICWRLTIRSSYRQWKKRMHRSAVTWHWHKED